MPSRAHFICLKTSICLTKSMCLKRSTMTRSFKIPACRIAFVVICLGPAIGSISYATWQRWIDSNSIAAAWLESRLGVQVSVESLRTSTPGVQKALSVKLMDPETEKLIAVCHDVRIRRGRAACVVSIDSVAVPPNQMMTLWRMLHDRVLRQHELLDPALIISVNRLALRDRDGEVEIDGLRIECQRSPQGPRSSISFRPRGRLDVRPVRINLLRDQTTESPVTRLRVESHDQALDCSLVTGSPEWLQRFGEAISFQGFGWLELQGGEWQGEISGQVHGLELERVSAAQRLPAMTGPATLDIREAILTNGRVTSLHAVLSAGPGSISAAALKSATALGLTPVTDQSAPRILGDQALSYDALAIMIQLDASGLALTGMLEPRDQQIAVTNGMTAVLRCTGQRLPVAALIEWVTGQAVPQALFTEPGAALFRVLPLKRGANAKPREVPAS